MNWLNLEIKTLRSPAYLGSDPVERATWLNVLAHCCEQENGGRLEGAALWKDRQWQQVCGVTMREVKRASKLLQFDGNDVLVLFYPTEKESEVKARREAGREGGKRSGEVRANGKQTGSTASSSASSNDASCARTEGEGERKENKKEKGSTPKTSQSDASDGDWLAELKAMDCYKPLNVESELGKATAWASTNNRKCTRRFFVNWLNRALERNRVVAPAKSQQPRHSATDDKL